MGISELDAVRIAVAVMRATGTTSVRLSEQVLTGPLPASVSWYYDLSTGELVARLRDPVRTSEPATPPLTPGPSPGGP